MANEFTYSINPDLEGDLLGQYSKELGEFTSQAPRLLQDSAQQQRQALEQSQKTGLMLMAEGAAKARAAAMGGAGQMAGGGGRAATLRQGGLSFGKSAADHAAEGFRRAAGLEQGLLQQQLRLKGEMIPGALLAMHDASMAEQDELTNIMNVVGTIESNNYWDSDRAVELGALMNTMRPGTEAYKYADAKMREYNKTFAEDFEDTFRFRIA
jgi:hypothetical protein